LEGKTEDLKGGGGGHEKLVGGGGKTGASGGREKGRSFERAVRNQKGKKKGWGRRGKFGKRRKEQAERKKPGVGGRLGRITKRETISGRPHSFSR